MEVLSLSFLHARRAAYPNEYLSSEDILRLYWTQTGEQGYGSRRFGHPDRRRNPFNDSLVASGSDDGKVLPLILR